MARSKGSRSGRRPSKGPGGGSAPAPKGAQGKRTGRMAAFRTFGLDPSFFAFRARDTRGLVVQLAAIAGLAVGLFVALAVHGPIQLGASDQFAQLAALASIVGLAALPIAAAAAVDARLAALGAGGSLSGARFARTSLVLPPVVALVVGLVLAPVLFAIGGQWLYLGVAAVALAIVVVAATLSYLGTASGDAGAPSR